MSNLGQRGKTQNFKDGNSKPCAVCRQQIKKQGVMCQTCKSITHVNCTGYSLAQVALYCLSSAKYTCEMCIKTVKGANGAYREAIEFLRNQDDGNSGADFGTRNSPNGAIPRRATPSAAQSRSIITPNTTQATISTPNQRQSSETPNTATHRLLAQNSRTR